MDMKRLVVLVMTLMLCLTAVSAMATATVTVSTADDFRAALTNAAGENKGQVVIEIAANTTLQGTFKVAQYLGTEITIMGKGNSVINGKLIVNGRSKTLPTTKLTVQNLIFDANGVSTDDYDYLFGQADQRTNERYPNNVTIKNCVFKGIQNGNGQGKDVVAIKARSSIGYFVVENCEAYGLHSMFWGTGCNNIKFTDLKVEDCGSGLHVGTSKVVEVTDSSFDVEEHAIRVDLTKDYPVSVKAENNVIDSVEPFVIRKDGGTKDHEIDVSDNEYTALTADQLDKVVTFTEGATENMIEGEETATNQGSGKENNSFFTLEMQNASGKKYGNDLVYSGSGNIVLKSSADIKHFVRATLFSPEGQKMVNVTNDHLVKGQENVYDNGPMRVESGSIKVTIKEELASELMPGTYKLEIESAQGVVFGTFTVPEPTAVDLPQTGDNSSLMLWSAMLALAAAGFVVTRKTRLN